MSVTEGVNATVPLKQNGNQVWHTGNDGSGSGMDADLWHARSMTDSDYTVTITVTNGGNQLQTALDNIPFFIMHSVTVNINGTGDVNIGFTQFRRHAGLGSVIIKYGTSPVSLHGGIINVCYDKSLYFDIRDLTIQYDPGLNFNNYYGVITGIGNTGIHNCHIDGYGRASNGISIQGGYSDIADSVIGNCKDVILAAGNALVISQRNTGSSNILSYEVNTGILKRYADNISSSTEASVYAGGQLLG